jgi:SAM-dependent methyltransferase
MGDSEYLDTNRRRWDELVPIHLGSRHYDVEGFRVGKTNLCKVELDELGPEVAGKTLLHLQCHFGLDTLSWARMGATVTGVDFSQPAIDAAAALAAECGIEARFLVADVYSLPELLDERFDIVYSSYGALCWLPDVTRWAAAVSHFVKPGGIFYMVEFHPFPAVFDASAGLNGLSIRYPYFTPVEPIRTEDDGSYAAPDARLTNRVTYSWSHGVGEVVSALISAGLRLEYLHEFPFTVEPFYEILDEVAPQEFRLREHDGSMPFLYSIRARRD